MATVRAKNTKKPVVSVVTETIAVHTFVFEPMEVVHEADRNIASGEVKRFANAADMIRSLRTAARKSAKK